ncbi:MAG: proprotein convertase P-domain-containing protein [Sphingopyxis sp.]
MAGPKTTFVSQLWRNVASAALTLLGLCFAVPSSAQVNQYTNTTAGAINDQTCGGTVLTRTFVVGTSYTVSDVNIGILLSHTYRADLEIQLTSPGGTTRDIMVATAGDGDNLNDMFDDEASSSISTHAASATDPLTPAPPPYSHSFQSTQTLSAFDGQNALGTWTLTICDNAAQDVGTFTRADLYITQTPTSYADLSLTKTVSNAAPAAGATISYTLGVTNAAGSPLSATGVQVRDVLPAGVTFVSAAGTGTYNSGTGIWSVGTLAPGASASLTITVTVAASAGATVPNLAEVWVSSAVDLDSTPANNSITEDDDAQVSFTVSGTRVAGTPPTLVCPAGTTIHDWDAITWAAGSISNPITIANIGTVNWGITNQGTWLNNGTYGGQSPAEQTAVTGGIAGGQQSLFQLTDMNNQSDVAETTITLPTAVPGLQMRIFDIDHNPGQFADRITVTGTFNGSPATPTLTNGVANYVIGNSAYGDAGSADTSANGNIWVTFATPVDTIVITYGNHSLAPANPGQQAIAIHDITFCRPVAVLSIAKTSSVINDPVNGATDPKMIPGAVVEYCLLASNAGSGTTTNVVITDSLPANVTYVTGSMTSAASCAAAGSAEDDDAAGADESDPFGMQLSGTTVGGTATSIGPSSAFAMRFRVTVN